MRLGGNAVGHIARIALCLWVPGVHGWARAVEKDALVQLYEATNGASWAKSDLAPNDEMLLPGGNNGWDLSSDPCPKINRLNESWQGVDCVDPCYYPIDGDDCRFGRITGLNLQFNGLEGTIPDSLFDSLINLTAIDLSHNSISGTIPTTVGKLRNTIYFQLSHNKLSGTIPTEIRTIGSHAPPDEMAVMLDDIAEYDDNGTLIGYDYEITKTMGLTMLDLGHNNLNGTIPTTIAELANLQGIDLSNNPELGADGCCEDADSYYSSFYGYNTTLPTEIGRLKKLQSLRLDHSRFMRQMPTEIGNMRALMYLRLQGSYETNQVSGTIPTQIGKLKNLDEFFMENNTLSGTIPSEIGAMSSLEMVTLQDNKLSGTLPDTMGDLEQLSLWDTFGNKLEGDMPSTLQKLANLDYFYIQNEQSDVVRNHYCQQRIGASAIGRKFNYAFIANEYYNYKYNSACANPYDVQKTFEPLSGDV